MSIKSSTFVGLIYKNHIVMAKQSGLHQIRGKVGEYSYYSQTGVQAGIIRAINQAMSAKVKNDEAFANTRLNNAEFGQACKIAAAIAQYIVPKYRPMILPFSQAKLAKLILEQIKSGTGNWGERNLIDAKGEKLAPILSSVAKNSFDDWGISYEWSSVDGQYTFIFGTQFEEKLAAIGSDGIIFKVAWANTWIGNYQPEVEYFGTYPHANFLTTEVTSSDSEDLQPDYTPAPPAGYPVTQSKMMVVIVLPYRKINNVYHTLQEHCTFKAFAEENVV